MFDATKTITERVKELKETKIDFYARVQQTYMRDSTYKNWVDNWKATYKELSEEIRQVRARTRVSDPFWSDLRQLSILREHAREMLVLRHVNKAHYKAFRTHYSTD